jgi:ribonuclease P protein component
VIPKEKIFETLKYKNEIDLVYKKGKTVKLGSGFVKAVYFFVAESEKRKTKVAAVAASRSGNSVWRNRFKRLIRESVRLETNTISEILDSKKSNLLIVFSPHRINQEKAKKLFLNEIKSDVVNILNNLSLVRGQKQ